MLVVFLEFLPDWLRVLSIIFLILMAPSSFAVRGIGQNIERWQKGIMEEKAAKKQERAAKKTAKNKPVKVSVSEKLPTSERAAKKKLPKNGLTDAQIKRQKRNDLIISLYKQGKKTGEIHQELLSQNYKVSERTVRGVVSEAKSPELNGK
jgi:Na+-transporting methylmalonyl-CoA/oxaloacetate decarboxylase gamma subunit